MKVRVTRKQIMNGYKNVISIPYCGLQTMLAYRNPRYYTAGTYGWGADIYEIDSTTVIVTGYAPFGNIKPAYEVVHGYELAAEKVAYADREELRERLIEGFVQEVCGND